MALAAAEVSLYTNKTDVPEVADKLSLEHLIPQEWETHWPLTDTFGTALEGEELAQASAERWARLNRLGNLTIVTQPLNSSMSHSPWEKKSMELNRHSKLLLNAELAKRSTWDEQAIDERGSWLAQRLATIWPGPKPENW